jgi:NTP pyrophosphatase (non-canonical NTP hydrolase)
LHERKELWVVRIAAIAPGCKPGASRLRGFESLTTHPSMNLSEIQKKKLEFDTERGWHKNRASNVFVHLVEELGEVGRYISFEEGYKKKMDGGGRTIEKDEMSREVAQVFLLFLQLTSYYDIDLEEATLNELEIAKGRFPVPE